jgi:PAS domain S-box-containing protein
MTSVDARQQELPLRTLAGVADAVVTVDATGRVTSWDPAAASLLGYRAETTIGSTLAALIPHEFKPRHTAGFHAAIESGTLRHGGRPAHIRVVTSGGEVRPMAMTLGPLRSTHGAIDGVAAVLRPVGDLETFA